jgi:hypothetical protein
MTVEIFKTDIGDKHTAEVVLGSLTRVFSQYEFNFDLDDRDKVLRVASSLGTIEIELIQKQVITKGFVCELIDY